MRAAAARTRRRRCADRRVGLFGHHGDVCSELIVQRCRQREVTRGQATLEESCLLALVAGVRQELRDPAGSVRRRTSRGHHRVLHECQRVRGGIRVAGVRLERAGAGLGHAGQGRGHRVGRGLHVLACRIADRRDREIERRGVRGVDDCDEGSLTRQLLGILGVDAGGIGRGRGRRGRVGHQRPGHVGQSLEWDERVAERGVGVSQLQRAHRVGDPLEIGVHVHAVLIGGSGQPRRRRRVSCQPPGEFVDHVLVAGHDQRIGPGRGPACAQDSARGIPDR